MLVSVLLANIQFICSTGSYMAYVYQQIPLIWDVKMLHNPLDQ